MATRPKAAKKKPPLNRLGGIEPVPLDKLGTGKDLKRKRAVRGGGYSRPRVGNPGLPPKLSKSRAEIAEMDADDPAFKIKDNRPRVEVEARREQGFLSVVQLDKQRRARERRAKIRKLDAEVMAAKREASMNGRPVSGTTVQTAEVQLIQQGDMTLEDWSDEELIRGYRKNRNGKFGPPPKWVPQQVAQEIHRRILKRGGKKLLSAYLESVDGLVELSRTADSEKVRLDAMREIQNRVSGKIPDRVQVSADDPWADMLADAYVPISDLPPVDVEGLKRPALEAPVEEDGGLSSTAATVETQGGPSTNGKQASSDGRRVILTEEDWDE